MPAQFTATSN
ncbi:hypothetical protein YPPY45_1643, partial [Yersinia pestis PY-45]